MRKRPTLQQLLKHVSRDRIVGLDATVPAVPLPQEKTKGLTKKTDSDEKKELALSIYAICKNGGWTLKTEHKFHSKRRFKFDWAILELKIAIEYEGLQSEKSGHTTLVGYTNNCDKYNLAILCGWEVFRYTAKNYNKAGNDLLTRIQQKHNEQLFR